MARKAITCGELLGTDCDWSRFWNGGWGVPDGRPFRPRTLHLGVNRYCPGCGAFLSKDPDGKPTATPHPTQPHRHQEDARA